VICDFPELGLLKHDRLEPNALLEDVAAFDSISEFPAKVLFWRQSLETRARHRNPLWDASLGITLDSLMIDKLHTLYLGPVSSFCCHALWQHILADAFGTEAVGENLHFKSVQVIKNRLWSFYKEARSGVSSDGFSEVSDFTVSMLGGKPGTATLHAKAVETKCLLPFVNLLLSEFRSKLSEPQAGYLVGAGVALQQYIDLCAASPRVVPEAAVQKMFDAVKKHIILAERAGVPMKPKHHLLLHLVARTRRHGNPNFYATFADEGINRIVKKIGEAAHRSVWEVRCLVHFRLLEERMLGTKRPASSCD
jgi:hypothetical protein